MPTKRSPRCDADKKADSAAGVNNYLGGFVNTGSSARAPYHLVAKGDMEYTVLTGNVGARFKPMPDLAIETALRGERWEDSGSNLANYSSQGVALATGVVTAYQLLPRA